MDTCYTANQAPFVASTTMDRHIDNDWLLLKHYLSPPFTANEQQCSLIAFATALILRAVGGVTGKLEWPSTLLRQLSFWRCTDLTTAKLDAYTSAPLHADKRWLVADIGALIPLNEVHW